MKNKSARTPWTTVVSTNFVEPMTPDAEREKVHAPWAARVSRESFNVDGNQVSYADAVRELEAAGGLKDFERTAVAMVKAALSAGRSPRAVPEQIHTAFLEAYMRTTMAPPKQALPNVDPNDIMWNQKRQQEHDAFWARRRAELRLARESKPYDLPSPTLRNTPLARQRALRMLVQNNRCDDWVAANALGARAVYPYPDRFPAHLRPAYEDVADWLDQVVLNHTGIDGLILWGPAGSGKTTLAMSAMLSLAAQGLRLFGSWRSWNAAVADYRDCPMTFRDTSDLMHSLTPFERLEDDEMSWWDYMHDNLIGLILDEIGMKEMTDHREDILKSIVDWSARGRVLIMTTNIHPDRWFSYFGERVADRMREGRRFHVVNVGNVSARAGG